MKLTETENRIFPTALLILLGLITLKYEAQKLN